MNINIDYTQKSKFLVTDKQDYKVFLGKLKLITQFTQKLFYADGLCKYKIYIKDKQRLCLKCEDSTGKLKGIPVRLDDLDIYALDFEHTSITKQRKCYTHPHAYIEVDTIPTIEGEITLINVRNKEGYTVIPEGCTDVTGDSAYKTGMFAK